MGTAFEYHLDENFNQSGKKHGFCSTRIAGLHDEFPTQVLPQVFEDLYSLKDFEVGSVQKGPKQAYVT